jgi:hypothetical protein
MELHSVQRIHYEVPLGRTSSEKQKEKGVLD